MTTSSQQQALSSERDSLGLNVLIFCCFLLSGATSLIYQVVWMRYLIHVFGGTTLAVSTLLTAFLGGLALGSYLIGRYVDRLQHPGYTLWLYAMLELGIGLYGLLTLGLFHQAFLGPIWKGLHNVFASAPMFSYLARFVIATVILLIPTVCMGATLPVLCKFMGTLRHRVVFDIGKLYTINTWGAVIGALAAGFFLLPNLGLSWTIVLTAILNGLIALTGLSLYFFKRPDLSLEEAPCQPLPEEACVTVDAESLPPPVAAAATEGFSARTVRIVLCCFALSGFTALLLEVVWTRLLTLIIGPSVYAFTTMLGTFLIGLALGSYQMTYLNAYVKRPIRLLALIQVLLGLSVFATLFLFAELPWWYVRMAQQYHKEWQKFLLGQVGLAALIMFVPTLLSGMTFPLVARIYAQGVQTVARRVGTMYAINTLGSLGGAFMTGFVLIPFVSLHWTILLGIFISLSLGWKLYKLDTADLRPDRRRPLLWRTLVNTAFVSLFIVVVIFQPGWPRHLMTAGVFVYYPQQEFQYATKEQFLANVAEGPQRETLYYKEGIATVVSVQKSPTANAIFLKNNGKGEGGVPINPEVIYGGGDMITQVLLAELPLLLHHGAAEHVLVVGFGTGTTAGSVLRSPEVQQMTIAELEAAVFDAAPYFKPENGDPLNKANVHSGRVRPVITDGRNYLLTSKEAFDVIISQPAEPWVSGAADLFTREYWQLGRDHLKPQGLFCQWIQLYGIDLDHLGILLKTFSSVFPETFIFRPGNAGELLLLGARDPLRIDVAQITSRLSTPEQKADLARIGLHSAVQIVSQLLLGPEDVARLTQYMAVNTDDNMLVEYGTPKTISNSLFTLRDLFGELGQAVQADKAALLANYGDSDEARRSFLLDMATSYTKKVAVGPPNQLRANPYVQSALRIVERIASTSALPEVHFALGGLQALIGETAKAQEQFTQVFNAEATSAASYIARGDVQQARNNVDKAIAEYEQALQLDPQNAIARLRLAVIHLARKEFEAASTKLTEAVKLQPDNADVYSAWGNYYHLQKQFDQAVAYYRIATERDRYHLIAHDNLAKIYYAAKLYSKAYIEFDTVRRLNPYYAEPYFYMGKILAMNKDTRSAIDFLSQYLQLSPAAKNAQEVRDEISRLQTGSQQKDVKPSS